MNGDFNSAGFPIANYKGPFRIFRDNNNRISIEGTVFNSNFTERQILSFQDGLVGPATVTLFLLDESGFSGSSSGGTTSLSITAPDYIDNRSSLSNSTLTVVKAARIGFLTEFGKVYQLRKTLSLTNPVWVDVAAPVQGTGQTEFVIDPDTSGPEHFYQVRIVD